MSLTMRRAFARGLTLTVSGLALAACAGSPPPEADARRGEHRPPPGMEGMAFGGADSPDGRRGGLNLFISPMGEPFRGRRDEPYPVAAWFARVNASHSGEVTEAEFVADADRFFDHLDANHDGVIDGFELTDYERVIAPEINPQIRGLRAGEGMDPSLKFDEHEGQQSPRGRGRGGGGERGGGARDIAGDLAGQGAANFSLLPDPEPVASASASLNGRITREEWRDAAHRRFQRLLSPGRATLTLATLPRTTAQLVLEQRRRQKADPDARRPPSDRPARPD